jgi:hypothetical protein
MTNRNDKLIDTFQGMIVQTGSGRLDKKYLKRINQTLKRAVDKYPRTSAMRFDLRYPKNYTAVKNNHISKFIASLKAIIHADLQKKKKGKSMPMYIWVKEQDSSNNPHYHVVIFLNGNIYSHLGYFTAKEGNTAARIRKAWASALGVNIIDIEGTVHYADNGTYTLKKNSPDYKKQYEALFYRLSYFAKKATKQCGDGSKNFGSSHK